MQLCRGMHGDDDELTVLILQLLRAACHSLPALGAHCPYHSGRPLPRPLAHSHTRTLAPASCSSRGEHLHCSAPRLTGDWRGAVLPASALYRPNQGLTVQAAAPCPRAAPLHHGADAPEGEDSPGPGFKHSIKLLFFKLIFFQIQYF